MKNESSVNDERLSTNERIKRIVWSAEVKLLCKTNEESDILNEESHFELWKYNIVSKLRANGCKFLLDKCDDSKMINEERMIAEAKAKSFII